MALTTEQNVYLHELHCKFTSGNISVPAAIEAFWNRFAPQQPSAERRETTMAPPIQCGYHDRLVEALKDMVLDAEHNNGRDLNDSRRKANNLGITYLTPSEAE